MKSIKGTGIFTGPLISFKIGRNRYYGLRETAVEDIKKALDCQTSLNDIVVMEGCLEPLFTKVYLTGWESGIKWYREKMEKEKGD